MDFKAHIIKGLEYFNSPNSLLMSYSLPFKTLLSDYFCEHRDKQTSKYTFASNNIDIQSRMHCGDNGVWLAGADREGE